MYCRHNLEAVPFVLFSDRRETRVSTRTNVCSMYLKLIPTNVAITNQLINKVDSIRRIGTHEAPGVPVTSSLQAPISIIHIKVPMAITLLVKIQLAHPTETPFD